MSLFVLAVPALGYPLVFAAAAPPAPMAALAQAPVLAQMPAHFSPPGRNKARSCLSSP